MPPPPIEGRPRIDEYLPVYEFSANYSIRIDAPASLVYQSLLRSDFNEHWLVRLLMTLRTGKRIPRSQNSGDVRQRLQGAGFVLLADVPREELVLGVAGQFWRFDGGRCLDLDANGFTAFSRSGYAKAAWDFRFRPESPLSTLLSTETRIQCLGAAASWRFRAYWTLVGPFSGLIRKAILQQVKAKAESAGLATTHSLANREPAPTTNP